MAKKKITISDMIDRFGRERIVKALTKRRFTNKKRSEMRKTGQKHMGFKKGGAMEPKYSVKQEVKDKMKKETPKTFSLLKGLSPVTQMRKYMTGKKVKAARARDEAKVKKLMGGGMAGLFGKRKNVEAGEPNKKQKDKDRLKENVTKKQKRLEELKKELGMARGGIRRKPKKPMLPPTGTDPTRPKPKLPPYLKQIKEGKKGMKKGGMKKADGIMIIMEKKKKGGEAKIKKVIGGLKKASKLHAGQAKMLSTIVKKAAGGITGKTTFGELSKRKPLKKGIRLKGKGSSFMKEYKKRVYNRAGGGSVNGGARGTGIAVKGHNFKGVF